MKKLAMLAALSLATSALAQDTAEPPVTPSAIVEASTAKDWIEIPAEDILVMELAPAANGSERFVVIQLMPAPFSQPWVENIRTLARAHWWDSTSIYRSVDNWVVQWGGGDTELGFAPPEVPAGITSPTAPYDVARGSDGYRKLGRDVLQGWLASLPANHAVLLDEYTELVDSGQIDVVSEWFSQPDVYAKGTGFHQGWPVAANRDAAWPVHCYGSVGVARDLAPDTGTGSELYAVIGHSPRQLDRNIAVVGRVVDGMEYLSTLPRGTGTQGVYETREEDTPIISVRLASERDDAATWRYEYFDTASESFARYAKVSANRQDDFYKVPAGGVDVCNLRALVRWIDPEAEAEAAVEAAAE